MCLDLKRMYGNRLKIGTDPAAGPQNRDPWLWTIVCRAGEISPWGGDMLCASTTTRGQTSRKLSRLACCRVVNDGDDGINAVFHVDDFDTVAAVMKPRKRRTLSAEHRAALAAGGSKTRY